jgi:hypothetical protein
VEAGKAKEGRSEKIFTTFAALSLWTVLLSARDETAGLKAQLKLGK